MGKREGMPAAQRRIVKLVLAVMALGTLATGFILYVFADAIGYSPDTAKTIAIVFLIVGLLDYLLLMLWDRIFGPK
jgi:hypothetical protein